jgi:hypothetical protein
MSAKARKQRRAIVEATAVAFAATDKRFCQDHQGYAEVSEGSIIQRGKLMRWTCNVCQQRRLQALVKLCRYR